MGVTVKFECDGCFTETEPVRLPYHKSLDHSAPKGWVIYDPYTQMTYCGDCWKEIMEVDR